MTSSVNLQQGISTQLIENKPESTHRRVISYDSANFVSEVDKSMLSINRYHSNYFV